MLLFSYGVATHDSEKLTFAGHPLMQVNQFISHLHLQYVLRETLEPELQVTFFGNQGCGKERLILPGIIFGLLAGIPDANFPMGFDFILELGPFQNVLDYRR